LLFTPFERIVPDANNELSKVIDILLPVTFYFNSSTRLGNVKTSDDSLLASRTHRTRLTSLAGAQQAVNTALFQSLSVSAWCKDT